ncbi:NAD(P)/FAD-dependent oxidoreductase [Dyadobacter luticola]|uniref:Tryptophan 7-halogenase n=1 Tax=Dyadobacter luticola TaxID=1979387 RepID=A0A5R9L384_9BACT|nr:tryptophan 7-halogenase [Dyadobacter luticola]TLV02847.1 tryptophan 7-halogenase [Dyadobacter luticola]
MSKEYDILIAGSGFAGSLAALILHSKGFQVCLVEKGEHPRFAIGESSTPIANMLLRDLAAEYGLDWLADFSKYGSWQRTHPEVVCGLKRGFSYFKHYPEKPFSTDEDHSDELLVAASINDERSDTNWLRADFDAFLVGKVQEIGIDYFDHTDIQSAARENGKWQMRTSRLEEARHLEAKFFIDATGGDVLLKNFFSVSSSSESFLTNSFAVFSHFDHLRKWSDMLAEKNISTAGYPYNPDNSALHHLLDEGWVWVLRFNNAVTSWGFALDGSDKLLSERSSEEIWDSMMAKYPDIQHILKDARHAAIPGKTLRFGRLQRKADKCFGDGWLALPHTAGFVDPLFSSGIAHSLIGLEKICRLFYEHFDDQEKLYAELQKYEYAVFDELKLIDMLVAGCYKTMPYFGLFRSWSMLYFTCTITYEKRRLQKLPVDHFLCAGEEAVKAIVTETYQDLMDILARPVISGADIEAFTNRVRERIQPFNTVGLLDPAAKNMYWHYE